VQLDACRLLTRAEVIKAIGEPLVSVKGGPSIAGARYCSWLGKDSKVLSRGITIIAAGDRAAQRYKQYAAVLKSRAPVAGLGAQAVTDGNVIVVRSAKSFVYIGPTYVKSGIAPAAVKALAARALARLDRG
jgi:hypothetical protein